MTFDEQLESEIISAQDLDQLAASLSILINGNFSVWRDGRLLSIRALVDRINGIRIEVRHKEHAPPHFHVIGDNFDVSFRIEDGTLLAGELSERQQRLIKWWFDRSQPKLKEAWNRTRPTDCPVGPIR